MVQHRRPRTATRFAFVSCLALTAMQGSCGPDQPKATGPTDLRKNQQSLSSSSGVTPLVTVSLGAVTPSPVTGEGEEPPFDHSSTASADALAIIAASKKAERVAGTYANAVSTMGSSNSGNIAAMIYDLGDLSAAATPLGSSLPSSSRGVPSSHMIEKGWSNATDNRTFVGTGSGWADNDPAFGAEGLVSSTGCTGTLFSGQLILTAGHCVFDGSGNFVNPSFAPRQRGTTTPYGTGSASYTWWATAYTANGCNVTYTESCVKYDYAVSLFSAGTFADSSGNAPPYMGLAWASDSTLKNWTIRNDGYPSCGANVMAPAGCQSNEPYGDNFNNCSGYVPQLSEGSTSNAWPFADGTKPKMKTGCDTSPGHSGGPIYSWSPGSAGPYIIGNTVWNECWLSSCKATTTFSSSGIRLSQTFFNWLVSQRNTYP